LEVDTLELTIAAPATASTGSGVEDASNVGATYHQHRQIHGRKEREGRRGEGGMTLSLTSLFLAQSKECSKRKGGRSVLTYQLQNQKIGGRGGGGGGERERAGEREREREKIVYKILPSITH
jgi:hypothetical protein